MYILRQKLITRLISFLIIFTFIWSNCVYASGALMQISESRSGISCLGMDAKAVLQRILPEARALETPLALHSSLLAENVRDLKELVANRERIRAKIMKDGKLKEVDLGNCYTMIFEDPSNGARAYYYFNKEGYFYRITDACEMKKTSRVEDIFHTAFLAKGVDTIDDEAIILNGLNIERFKVSNESLDAINICMEELYGVEALSEPERVATPVVKSHPAGMDEDEDGLAEELAAKYPTLRDNENALENYRFLKETLGDRLDEAINEAAEAVGVTPELVVSGVIGQNLDDINGGREFKQYLAARDPRKGFGGIISSGGGGAFSSNMVHEMRDLAPDEKMRIMRAISEAEVAEKGHYLGKNLVAVIDDGGRTGKLLRKLFDIPEWGIFVAPWGDLISVTIWGASDDVITLVYRSSNLFNRININTADEELIREVIDVSLTSFERRQTGILDGLAGHIVTNRPVDGYDDETLNRIVSDYLSSELGLSGDDISDTAEKVKVIVENKIMYEGDHELSLTDLMKGTRLRKVFDELGKAFKKNELKLSKGFWFYMSNILNTCRQYDENFVETGISPLEGVNSSLNAVLQGAYELGGVYTKGADGQSAGVHPERGLEIFNAAVGSSDVYSGPISYDQATLCGILEAASFRLSKAVNGRTVNDTYVIGEDQEGRKGYIRPIRYLNLGRLAMPITEHLLTEDAQSISRRRYESLEAQKTGVDINVKRSRSGGKTEQYIDGRLVKVMHRFDIKFGSKQIILGEVEGEDGKAAVIVDGRIEIIRTDATWQPVEIEVAPGVRLSFKSRLIITQDWVTGNKVDEPHPAPIRYITFKERVMAINPNIATREQLKFYLRVSDRIADAIIEHRTREPFEKVEDLMKVRGIGRKTYEKIEKYVILDREGAQSYDRYVDLPEDKWPKADDTALDIVRQGYVFFTPKGSLFTSLACNMLYPKFVKTLVGRVDLTRVFIAKYKRDIEAAGLTLSEQYEAFLRSIQMSQDGGVLGKGDRLYRYIIIPRVADRLRDNLIKDRAKKAETIRKKIDMGDTSAKVSKVPTDVQLIIVNINEADKTALMLLPHITEEIADRIIEYRDAHGRFSSKDEIENIPEVRAFGEDLLEVLMSCIILEGDDDIAYFRRQGIVPIIVYTEKKLGYDELQILDLLTFTGERDTLLGLLPEARRSEIEEREQVLEFRNGESFWAVTWWDDIFGVTEGDEVTVGFGGVCSYSMNLPKDLDEGQLYIAAYYLANYVYNRMIAIGADEVNLSCDSALFNKVKAILDSNFNFENSGYVITNNTEQAAIGRLEVDSVSLEVKEEGVELICVDNAGQVVRTEPSDMVIDMALQAARDKETNVHGAVSQYITQEGVARIARSILPGNLRNSDVEKDLNRQIEEVLKRYLDDEGRLRDRGLTPKEFYALFDLSEALEENRGIEEFIEKVEGVERAAEILGLGADRINSGNLLEVKRRVSQLVGTHSKLAEEIVNKTADKFIKKVKGYYEKFGMHTVLLSSSRMCLGKMLGRRLGDALTARLDGMPIDICLEEELSYDMVYRKFLENDPAAVEVFKVAGKYLAVTLEELYNIFGVRNIYLSGAPYDSGPGGDFIIGIANSILAESGIDVAIERRPDGISGDSRDDLLNKTYKAVMLDIDGVLRKIGPMEIVPDKLIRKIASLVNNRAIPIAINSNRSLESQNKVLLDSLRRHLKPESQKYVSSYYVENGKLYMINLGTGESEYIKDLPVLQEAQISEIEGIVRDVAQDEGVEIRDIAATDTKERVRVKFRDLTQVESFVNYVAGAFESRGISYAKVWSSGVYCEITHYECDPKKDVVEHYESYIGLPLSEMARIGDQVQRNGVDYTFANFSTERVDSDGEAVGIDLQHTDAVWWYLNNLTQVAPEASVVKSIKTLMENHMLLSAIYALCDMSEASPYYKYGKGIIESVYSSEVVSELIAKMKRLRQIVSEQEVGLLKDFIDRIDNTIVNPERVSWFIDDILEDIEINGTTFAQAMDNAQRRLFVGPQEMWAYLVPMLNIVNGRPVVFVARNEELQNAWQDLVNIAEGLGKGVSTNSYLVKLSRKETLGAQINAVLTEGELTAHVSGDLWSRLDRIYQSLDGVDKDLIDTELRTKGVTNGWNDINGMTRGRVVGFLADIGIDADILAYWDNYRESRKLKQIFRHALGLRKMDQVREAAVQWEERNRMLLAHIQSLINIYGVEVPEFAALSSLVRDFSGLVDAGEDFDAIEAIGSEIYSVWLRNINMIFNSVSPEMLKHATRPLLNVLLEDTDFCRDIGSGVVFVDDITTGGRTMLLSKLFSQVFKTGVNSEFIPVVKRNRIPEGHYYYVSQLVRLPEDCPDVSGTIYYETRMVDEDIPVLVPVTLDESISTDYDVPTTDEIQRYDELIEAELTVVRSELPEITLSDRVIKQVIKNCLTGVQERDLGSIYGLMIENYYNPSPVQYGGRKQYRYEVGEVYRFYSSRAEQLLSDQQNAPLFTLAQKIKPYEEFNISREWKRQAEIYRAKQLEVVGKVEASSDIRGRIVSLSEAHETFRQRSVDLGTEVVSADLSADQIVQNDKFIGLIRLHRNAGENFSGLLDVMRDQLRILNTQFIDIPDVLPEGGFASEAEIGIVLAVFGIEHVEQLTVEDIEQLIREYNKALALIQIYLNKSNDAGLREVSYKIKSLLVSPRVAKTVQPGTKSHPAGRDEFDDLIDEIISQSGSHFEWDRDQLRDYYIPLAQEIISRQQELGRRYVVGISGPGGIGKTEFTRRFRAIIEVILGEGKVGVMLQDEFYCDLSVVGDIKQGLSDRGDRRLPGNRASPRFLDVPYMLEQIQAFRNTGRFEQPAIERTRETRQRVGLNRVRAEDILLVDGHYLFTNDSYNDKFTPDAEWAAHLMSLYDAQGLHLFIDADLELIKKWKTARPRESEGRSPQKMEQKWQDKYKRHAMKSKEDRDNADIVLEKGDGHVVKKILWDEEYGRGRISQRFGSLPKRKAIVHIVGPARSGKTEIATYIGEQLGCVVFNTGDIFRPYTYKAMTTFRWLREIKPDGEIVLSQRRERIFLDDVDITDRFKKDLLALVNSTELQYEISGHKVRVKVDGVDVTEHLHDSVVNANVDIVSNIKDSRKIMKLKAKPVKEELGKIPLRITTGRGFNESAICRMFITATLEERTKRACNAEGRPNFGLSLKQMQPVIRRRDNRDRIFVLLNNYTGVYRVLDTTSMSLVEQNREAYEYAVREIERYNEERRMQEGILDSIIKDRQQNNDGTLSFIFLKGGEKGGVKDSVRRKILGLLEDDFEIHIGRQKRENLKTIFMRWKAAIKKFVEGLAKEEDIDQEMVDNLKKALDKNDPWKFRRSLAEIADDLRNKGISLRRVQRLKMLFAYIKDNDNQLVVLKRKRSRRDILASRNISVELAREFLGGRNPFEVDEQDFIKAIVVGPTRPYKALPGMLRYVIYKEQTRRGGDLCHALSEGRAAGLDDHTIMSICNGIHSPSTEELALEVGLIDLDDAQSVLDYVRRALHERAPPSFMPYGKPVLGNDVRRHYQVRTSLPTKLLSIDEIKELVQKEADRLAGGLDINTFEGSMQYWLLQQRLNFMLNNVVDAGQTMTEEDRFNFYNTLVAMMNLVPYVMGQVPQDDHTNIYLARDSGVLYMAYNMINRLLGRDDKNNHVFHLSRKNMGSKVYSQMLAIVKKAHVNNPENIGEFLDLIMPDFRGLMSIDRAFREKARQIYLQLIDAGIVNESNNKLRVVDTWTGGRLSTYLMAVIRFFNDYEIDGAGEVEEKADRDDRSFAQFIVEPKHEEMCRYSEVFDLGRTGLTKEAVESWYQRMGSECRFANEEVFKNFMEQISVLVFTSHYPYGELNLGHKVDWDFLKQRLTYSSPAKQLGAYLREIMITNSVIHYIQDSGIEREAEPDKAGTKSHPAGGDDSEGIDKPERQQLVAPNDFLKYLGINLTDEESALYEEWVSVYNEHYVTESDGNQINILVNTAYLIKIAGPEVIRFLIDNGYVNLEYDLAVQQLIDAIKRIGYHYFVSVFNSLLSTEGTIECGIELLKRSPGEIAIVVDEASLVYRKEALLRDEFLVKARTQAGLEGIVENGELNDLIRNSNERRKEEIDGIVLRIGNLPEKSVVPLFGPSGSGKSIVAREVVRRLKEQRGRSVLTLQLDNYYKRTDLPRTPPEVVNLDTPEAIDWGLVESHLRALLAGEKVGVLTSKSREPKTEEVQLDDILIIDGLYANSEKIMTILIELNIANLTVGVECIPYLELGGERCLTSCDIRELRRIGRDISRRSLDRILKRFALVKSGEREYVLSSLRQADVFINTFQSYNICFLRNVLSGEMHVSDESLRPEVERLESILRLVPELNPNISKWRKQLEDSKRLVIELSGGALGGTIDIGRFDEQANFIKDALFYNFYNEELLQMVKNGVESTNAYLKIICAYVLVDIGDDNVVTVDERYKCLDILVQAVADRILPRDDILKDRIDFHVHSYCSDGLRSVSGLVFEAWFRGMRAIAITDHNTFDHMEEAVNARELVRKVDFMFEVIPGIEINVSDPHYGSGSEHILAYFPIDTRIQGREDRDAFLKWLEGVKANPFVEEIMNCDLWYDNAYKYRLDQLRGIVEGRMGDVGIVSKFLDLGERDFVGLSPAKKFVSLVSYAVHRKYGLSMDLVDRRMRLLAFDRKEIPGNEILKTLGYSGLPIGDTLEFLRSISGVTFVAHPKYLILKKEDTRKIDKTTPEGRAARVNLKIGKLEAFFAMYADYLDGIECYYPEHEDDLIVAIQGFINRQNQLRRSRNEILVSWGTDYHHRPGEMARGRAIHRTKLATGFEEGQVGYIHSSVGTNFYAVERIKERAIQKAQEQQPVSKKRHPSGLVLAEEKTPEGYLHCYEGVTYINGRFDIKDGASGGILKFAEALNKALELIPDIASRRGPPIYVHVKPGHSANLTKEIDSRGRVHLVFDERFISYFTDPQIIQTYPPEIQLILPKVTQWIIAERIGHELSHDNRMGTPEKERLEEISVIRDFDVPFYRALLEDKMLKAAIDRFFKVVKPRFRSGHFYGAPEDFPNNRWINGIPKYGFLAYVARLPLEEVPAAIEKYVDIFYNFGIRKSHPAGMISDDEIRDILAQPTDFRASSEINDLYKNLTDYREIKMVFDCGKSVIREYTIRIPNTEEVSAEVIDYIALYIYNRLGEIGAQSVYIEDEQIRRAIDEKYNIDDKSQPRDRAFLKMRKNLKGVYGRPFEFVPIIPEGTTVVEKEPFEFNENVGVVVAIDIGKSDIKVIAMKDGVVTYFYKEDWDPGSFDHADKHIGVIQSLIDMAQEEGGLSKIDAIGLSVNLVVMDGLVVGRGPMRARVKDREQKRRIKELGREISTVYNGVPVSVLNDGDASAIWAYEEMGMRSVLGLSLGSGLAAGYGDKNGDVINLHGEMGNVVIDVGPNASGHSVTKMPGAAQQYLSQRAVFRLAEQKGLDLNNIPESLVELLEVEYEEDGSPGKASKLRYAQYLFENGRERQQNIMTEIYVELGRYLAAAVAEASDYLNIETVILFGRVTKGDGGEIIKRAAEIVLEEQYPNLNVGIQLPKEPLQDKPSDFYREFAQAIGAVYFANKEKQREESGSVRPGIKSHPAGGTDEGLPSGIWEAGLTSEGMVEEERILDSESDGLSRINRDKLQDVLARIKGRAGEGIFSVVDKIRVVKDLGDSVLSSRVIKEDTDSRVLLLDVKAFDDSNWDKLYLSVDNGLRKGIMAIIPYEDEAVKLLTADYMSVKLGLAEGIEIEVTRELRRRPEIKDGDIVAVCIEDMRSTDYGRSVLERFSFAKDWAERIGGAQDRYGAAIGVFNEIMEAKLGEDIVQSEELQKGLMKVVEEMDINVRVIKTFVGNTRVVGLEEFSRRLQKVIGTMAKAILGRESMRESLQKASEAKTSEQYWIIVDEEHKRVLEEGVGANIMNQQIEALRNIKDVNDKSIFNIVYDIGEVPLGAFSKEKPRVVGLVDFEDVNELDRRKDMLYMPTVYTSGSLYLAAHLVLTGGHVDDISDMMVMGIIIGLCKTILSKDKVTERDLYKLFREPWTVVRFTERLDSLRIAIIQIEKAA